LLFLGELAVSKHIALVGLCGSGIGCTRPQLARQHSSFRPVILVDHQEPSVDIAPFDLHQPIVQQVQPIELDRQILEATWLRPL
jgi:hypothetical protein